MTTDELSARVARIERENRVLKGALLAGVIALLGLSSLGNSDASAADPSDLDAVRAAFRESKEEAARRASSGSRTGLLLGSADATDRRFGDGNADSDSPPALTVGDGPELYGWLDYFPTQNSVSLGLIDPTTEASIYIAVHEGDHAAILVQDYRGKVKFFKRTKVLGL